MNATSRLAMLLILTLSFLGQTMAAVPTIKVTKYDHNPIYNENGAMNVRWPVVQHVDGTYYLFYGHAGGFTDIYYAISADGVNFICQGYALKRNDKLECIEAHTVFKYDSTRWIMYYCHSYHGLDWTVGCAFSNDLKNWTKYSDLLFNDHESRMAADPCVIRVSTGKYLMYYGNYDNRSTWQIALATSNDGLVWRKYDCSPVLTFKLGTWYSYYVAPTDVLEKNGKILLMVVGKSAETGACEEGLFESSDLTGTVFHEMSTEPSPCIQTVSGTWESQLIEHSDFETINDITYVYYCAYDGVRWQLGRATIDFDTPAQTSYALVLVVAFIFCLSIILVCILTTRWKKQIRED